MPRGVHLFAGLDAGLGLLSTSVAGEANKSGYSASIKGLGSYYFDRWVGEFGGALFRNRVKGTRTDGTEILIEHTSLYLELGARYLLGKRWELGGFGMLVFGDDLSFRPTVLPLRAEGPKSNFLAVGLQGLYRFSLGNSWLGRVGLRAATDINIADRQYSSIQGVIHIGLPATSQERKVEPPPETVKTISVAPPKATAPKRKRVSLPKINFDTGSTVLEAQSRHFLEGVGAFLGKNPQKWGDLEVEGHSDSRGSAAKNLSLSKARAASVRSALVKGGADGTRIQAIGYGATRPLVQGENQSAWFQNRRVDFQFTSDSEMGPISDEIDRLRQIHQMH